MPTLRELQTRVMRAILDGMPGEAAAWVRGDGAQAVERLGIYANNARTNFIESLHLSFPAVRRLVGDDYFDQCARDFRAIHPSRSGDLQHTGAEFAAYLATLHAGGEFRYLPDVARFEWLHQEALIAPDHAPFDVQRLAGIDPAAAEHLCFRLHPSARLFASPFPVAEIWEANVQSSDEPPLIDLDKGEDRLLLTRTRRRVTIYRLTNGERAFLERLVQRETFGAAVEAAARADARFDASAALQRLVLAEAIVDFEVSLPH
jgi:hypothetical protein